MAMKKFRNMKVYEQSGYQYKSTPAIMLKGQWLREAGFDCGTSITVTCEEGRGHPSRLPVRRGVW